MEIPQRRPKDSARVHQTLFLLGGGVWGRDYVIERGAVGSRSFFVNRSLSCYSCFYSKETAISVSTPYLIPSLEPRPLPFPQRWMYCITSTRRERSGNSCTVFVFSRGICIEPMGCEMSCDFRIMDRKNARSRLTWHALIWQY